MPCTTQSTIQHGQWGKSTYTGAHIGMNSCWYCHSSAECILVITYWFFSYFVTGIWTYMDFWSGDTAARYLHLFCSLLLTSPAQVLPWEIVSWQQHKPEQRQSKVTQRAFKMRQDVSVWNIDFHKCFLQKRAFNALILFHVASVIVCSLLLVYEIYTHGKCAHCVSAFPVAWYGLAVFLIDFAAKLIGTRI